MLHALAFVCELCAIGVASSLRDAMSGYDDYVLEDPPAMWGEDECLPFDELHPLIGSAVRPLLDQGDMAAAVEAAWRVLRDLLRQRLGSHDDGRALVDAVGQASKNPRLPLTPNLTPSQRSQHDGIVHLLRGVVAYVRNPAAHESQSPFAGDRWTTLHLLTVMSLCAEHVEDSGTAERMHRAVAILSQPDYPRTAPAIEAAVGRVARQQRSRFIAELLARARGFARRKEPQLAGVLAGYDYVMGLYNNPKDVLETAAAGVSYLLLVASTTEAGLGFLTSGVTERLDPAAYAKVRQMLTSAVTSAGLGGERRLESDVPSESSPALNPERLGRLCATLREPDRAHLVTLLLAALHGNEAQAAYAARALPAVLGTGLPTELRERAAEGISQALVGEYASDVADALRPARDLMPSFRHSLRAALGRAVESASRDPTSAAVASELRDELASLDRRRRRSAPRTSRA